MIQYRLTCLFPFQLSDIFKTVFFTLLHHVWHPSLVHVHLQLEDKVAEEPEDDEEDEEADDVEPEEAVLHAEDLEELDGVAVDAELVLALERLAVEAVDGEHGALEAVAHVGDVAEPLHQVGNVVEGDEEAWKEMENSEWEVSWNEKSNFFSIFSCTHFMPRLG